MLRNEADLATRLKNCPLDVVDMRDLLLKARRLGLCRRRRTLAEDVEEAQGEEDEQRREEGAPNEDVAPTFSVPIDLERQLVRDVRHEHRFVRARPRPASLKLPCPTTCRSFRSTTFRAGSGS